MECVSDYHHRDTEREQKFCITQERVPEPKVFHWKNSRKEGINTLITKSPKVGSTTLIMHHLCLYSVVFNSDSNP